MNREKFGSRIGFILVSAGCAIGLGNVWKFPYMCGEYGGAAFILIYLLFLLLLGLPILICEFAVGRASRKSIAVAFEELEPKGTKWHKIKYLGIAGNYLLMMFYTTVAGWMLYYCVRCIRGDFAGATPEAISAAFDLMLGNAPVMVMWTAIICILGFLVCLMGLQNGIEKITKVMMSALLVIMVILAINSVFLDGATEGVRFYLIPDFGKMVENGIGNVIFGAMNQAFFTLSIGMGSMLIFGSYLGKERRLTGEVISITVLDTFVALTAGFIIIPACFAYGIEPGAGPSLVFITLPNIFAKMPGGVIWSALFFLFLTFAAFSTVTAVFENLVSFNMDMFGWTRKKSVFVCAVLILVLSMPCVLGYNLWSGIQPIGDGSTIMDFEDFIVSNNILPLGSLAFILFCTRKNGWGWDAFVEEADTGSGMAFPKVLRGYITYVIPVMITVIYLKGYYDMFNGKAVMEGVMQMIKGQETLITSGEIVAFAGWMLVSLLMLGFVFYCAFSGKKEKNSMKKK